MKINCYGYTWQVYDLKQDRSKFPKKEGMYVIRAKDMLSFRYTILYAGSTSNFRYRMNVHEVLAPLKKELDTLKVSILYFGFEKGSFFHRKTMEYLVIRRLDPLINIQWSKRNSKKKLRLSSHLK